jgi:hypothetical protein
MTPTPPDLLALAKAALNAAFDHGASETGIDTRERAAKTDAALTAALTANAAEIERLTDILRCVCTHLELPQSESGPADDVALYDKALEGIDEHHQRHYRGRILEQDAEIAEKKSEIERLTKALAGAKTAIVNTLAALEQPLLANGAAVHCQHALDLIRRAQQPSPAAEGAK